MNILITACDSYMRHAITALQSFAENNPLEKPCIYLISSSATQRQLERLKSFGELHFIKPDNCFANAPLSAQFSRPEVYYRLLAPYILPPEVERILYLDSDVIISKPLRDFYRQPLDGICAAVVPDKDNWSDDVAKQNNMPGMSGGEQYFNSGVMLINTAEFCKTVSLDEIMLYIEEKRGELQDILNHFLRGRVRFCDSRYNYQVYAWEVHNPEKIAQDIEILHYTDHPKPWSPENKSPAAALYWRYALKAGFADEYLEYRIKQCGYDE